MERSAGPGARPVVDPAVYVGVDGGGTGTRVVVVAQGGEVLGQAEAPPAGVTADRVPHAVGLVADTVRTALGRAGIEPPARGLCAGLAGGGRAHVRRELEALLEAHDLALGVRVVADAEAGHYDAFAGGPGLLLAAGTGSVAWGKGADGRTVRVGGWGPLVGDEGSGYILALEAVRAVLWSHDGRGRDSSLTGALLDAVGLEEPQELVDWVARGGRGEVAELARPVMEEAESGDFVAASLVDRAARELTAHLDAAFSRLGDSLQAVAFTGGLLLPGTLLRRRMEEAVQGRGVRLVTEEVNSARGAAHMALHLHQD